jgi:hypothetical protein
VVKLEQRGFGPGREIRAPMGKPTTERIKIEQHTASGALWFAAWLFTIGFLGLGFWKGVLAVLLWRYYLGTTFAGMIVGS